MALTVSFPLSQVDSNEVLEDSIEIQIFADLALTSPAKPDASLLITPNTEMPVRTSRDGAAAQMSYKVANVCGQNAVATVSKDGVLRSGTSLGTDTLQVGSFGLVSARSGAGERDSRGVPDVGLKIDNK